MGGDPNSSIGSIFGNGDGDGVFDGWVGALGGVGSIGDLVGGGVCSFGCLGDGDGDASSKSVHF